ncbi:MAG: class I SAM-dependent methyltransferase [Acidimicrobiaceae bacterium]|nr:class I SAM-dependent methyltransferase [Acidimicrobiaceae bacterium]
MPGYVPSWSFAARRAAYSRDPRLRPWGVSPWRKVAGIVWHRGLVGCNICGWYGERFDGMLHSESATCLGCGSIARDRFLYHCWTTRVPYSRSARVLETSPRLGPRYRQRMARVVDYLASDYDERAHRANLHIDLQAIDLPAEDLDVILTAHVLEHVPDTDQALSEVHRVLKPGGVALIAVPVPQAVTISPTQPEYHGDETLVYWRFGLDLTDRLRDHGFATNILVTEDFVRRMTTQTPWGYNEPDVQADDLLAGADRYLGDMVSVASERECQWLGLAPSFFFVAWEACKPAQD